MYVDDRLGATPVDAIFAVAALKNLFGIGKKKRELRAIEQNAQGRWTGQFPPYADWDEYLRRPASNPKAIAAGATTMSDEYDYWRKRKDSILVKNQIATPQDYAAWLIATYGLKDGWIKPDAAPGSEEYKRAPVALGSSISIYDFAGLARWAADEQAKLEAAIQPVDLVAQPVAPPPVQAIPAAPGFVDRIAAQLEAQARPSQFLPGAPSIAAPPPVAPPPAPAAATAGAPPAWWFWGGGAVIVAVAAIAARRRRR